VIFQFLVQDYLIKEFVLFFHKLPVGIQVFPFSVKEGGGKKGTLEPFLVCVTKEDPSEGAKPIV
jgi:hypothetical protein